MPDAPARILVVDDEPSITEFVEYALRKEGFSVDVIDNGEDALSRAMKNDYDLFVLDIMLPGIDGYELCRRLRTHTSSPALFLSARDSELDKVVGLEIGGDDYLSKPFGVRELIARVRALLRRSQGEDFAKNSSAITAGGITLNEDAHTATGDAGDIDLTPREFELLAALMKNAGKVVSREDLLRDAWAGNTSRKRKRSIRTSSGCVIRFRAPDTIPASWKRFAATDTGSRNKATADIFRASRNAVRHPRGRLRNRGVAFRVRTSALGVLPFGANRRIHVRL